MLKITEQKDQYKEIMQKKLYKEWSTYEYKTLKNKFIRPGKV